MGDTDPFTLRLEDAIEERPIYPATTMRSTEYSESFLTWIYRTYFTESLNDNDENSLPTIADQEAMDSNPVNASSVNMLYADVEMDWESATGFNDSMDEQGGNNADSDNDNNDDENGTAASTNN